MITITADQIRAVVSRAREKGERPALHGIEAPGAHLRGIDLHSAVLIRANLRCADLTAADFTSADLRGVDLTGADLARANLRSANLAGADLAGADLTLATLDGANLDCARGLPVLSINGMPSGHLVLLPTPAGWRLSIGCWRGTPAELRELIARDDWPSRCNAAERDRRRPMLTAAADAADAFIAANPGPHFPTTTD